MDLVYLFKVLLRKIWILITVPVIAGAIGFFFANSKPEVYKSTAQISTGITTKGDVPFEEDNFNFRESEIKFNNLLEILDNDLTVSLVSYKLLLHDLEDSRPFRKPQQPENDPFQGDKNELENLKQYLRAKLDTMQILSNMNEYDKKVIKLLKLYRYDHVTIKSTLKIDRIKFTDYILISSYTDSPLVSAFVVNQLAEQFIRYNGLNNLEKSDESVKFFANLVSQKKKELDEKAEALRIFKRSNLVLDYKAENQVQEEQIGQFELAKNQEEAKIRQLNISIANIQDRIGIIKNGGDQSTLTKQLNQQILTLRNSIQKMNQRYIETGSNNQTLLDSLVLLRREYQTTTDKVNSLLSGSKPAQQNVSDLENQYNQLTVELQIAESSLSSINFKLRTLRAGKSNFASKEVTIADLERELDVASKEYIDAQQRYNTARNTAMAAGSSIKQVMIGQPAFSPESNKVMITTLFSFIVGLFLSTASILGIELLDMSIRTPQQFKRSVKLKFAGPVNLLHRENAKENFDLQHLFNSQDEQSTTFTHLIRNLRYELESSRKKVFLFTSTKKGEGKTFLIVSLAFSLSLIKKKVLVIDTNFKNNNLSKALPAHKEPEKIADRRSMPLVPNNFWDNSDSRGSLIIPTLYTHIDKIDSKSSSKSASEILIEKNFDGLLSDIAAHYDYIFMEGPALNEFSDTKELSQFAELIIPVFAAGTSLKQIDKESISYLRSLGEKLGPAILNKVEFRDLKQ